MHVLVFSRFILPFVSEVPLSRDELWTKHDCRSRLDPKMSRFLSFEGMRGYGTFWALIEILHYQNEHEIDVEIEIEGIAAQLNLEVSVLQAIIGSAIGSGLLKRENGKIYQSKLKQEQANRSKTKQDIANARSEAGRKGGLKSGEARRIADEPTTEEIPGVGSKPKQTQAKRIEEKRKDQNRLDLKDKNIPEPKNQFGECGNVWLSKAQHTKYLEELGEKILARCVELLDNDIEKSRDSLGRLNPEKYKNGINAAACFRTWVIKAVMEEQAKAQKIQGNTQSKLERDLKAIRDL